MSEIWKVIPGLGLYEVSDHGRVRSLRRGAPMIMKPNKVGRGYHALSLWADGVAHRRYVHHLVLLAFIGPRPSGMEACHGDADITNNRLSNLRWDTHSANVRDTIRHGNFTSPAPRGEANGAAKMTAERVSEARRLHAGGRSIRSLAKQFRVSKPTMQSILRRITWKEAA